MPNKRIFDLIRLAAYKRTRGWEGRQWEEEGNEPPNIFDKFTSMPLMSCLKGLLCKSWLQWVCWSSYFESQTQNILMGI